uniref:Uncharacterized protein n=2 Tax=environmental samples TaxID=68359 RepID=A0A075H5S6_9EURY|nr:hypothetical protein [uncultured marine group II/III euryarchaeote KM3_105_E02]AIF09303.1 hypothetical protein [uncultured marine group II/III euryarchaeote KM3_35_G08]
MPRPLWAGTTCRVSCEGRLPAQTIVKPNGKVAGSMSMLESEWGSALTSPSRTASGAAVLLGAWVLLLTVVNLLWGAYSSGMKVLWIGFVTGDSAASNIAHDGLELMPDDIVFGLIGVALLGLGAMGIGKAVEGGFSAWINELPRGVILSSLFSPESGVNRTMASWMIILGVGFYLCWSAVNTTWVDPGVYAMMIVMVCFGFAVHTMADAES